MNITRQERSAPQLLDKLHIHTWIGEFAPSSQMWNACLGEYDLGTKIFTGPTQREAINELLDYFEQDNGEIRK